jgi:hypothetical protein
MNSSSGETPLRRRRIRNQDHLYNIHVNLSETGIVNIDFRLSSWETYYRLAALRTPDKRRPIWAVH